MTNGFKRDLTNNDFAKYEAAKRIEASRKKGEKVRMLDVIGQFEENKLPNYCFRGNGDGKFSWGDGSKLAINGILMLAGPWGLLYSVPDLAVGLSTGISITDRIAAGVDYSVGH